MPEISDDWWNVAFQSYEKEKVWRCKCLIEIEAGEERKACGYDGKRTRRIRSIISSAHGVNDKDHEVLKALREKAARQSENAIFDPSSPQARQAQVPGRLFRKSDRLHWLFEHCLEHSRSPRASRSHSRAPAADRDASRHDHRRGERRSGAGAPGRAGDEARSHGDDRHRFRHGGAPLLLRVPLVSQYPGYLGSRGAGCATHCGKFDRRTS
jgi:hypothetical protein